MRDFSVLNNGTQVIERKRGQIRYRNGAMKSSQSCLLMNGNMQCCDIAVPDKHLWIVSDDIEIETRQQAGTAITSPYASNGIYIRVGKGLMEIRQTVSVGTGEVSVYFTQVCALSDLKPEGGQVRQGQSEFLV